VDTLVFGRELWDWLTLGIAMVALVVSALNYRRDRARVRVFTAVVKWQHPPAEGATEAGEGLDWKWAVRVESHNAGRRPIEVVSPTYRVEGVLGRPIRKWPELPVLESEFPSRLEEGESASVYLDLRALSYIHVGEIGPLTGLGVLDRGRGSHLAPVDEEFLRRWADPSFPNTEAGVVGRTLGYVRGRRAIPRD